MTGEGRTAAGIPTAAPGAAGPTAETVSESLRALAGPLRTMDKIPMRICVELGRSSRMLRELVALRPGSVLVLEKSTGEPMDVRVNDILLARGEVVAGDESFGVRITRLVEEEE